MAYLDDILARGRLNKNAVSRVDSSGRYRFKSYTYGVGRYVRVCAEIKAVYQNVGHTGNAFSGSVNGVPLNKHFRLEARCIDALVAEAKRQRII